MVEKSNINIIHNCKYHIVFCPKYKKPVLIDEVKLKITKLITVKCKELNIELHNINVNPNYVDIIISCNPQYGVHKAIKAIKNYTSRELREEFSHLKSSMPSMWTNNYYCSTIGELDFNSVDDYIKAQEVRTSRKTVKKGDSNK